MATKPREQSASGFYHVYQRGVSLFDIFEDDTDREFFLERLQKYCRELGVELHAWCLMSNHAHLLLRASLESLSAMMRKFSSVYARFFNTRHMRSGPLFEGRFCSVCVETDAQYMNVIRYIHRNPIHHEEAALCGSYPWSSYGEYVAAEPLSCKIEFALSLFGGADAFAQFHSERDDERQRHLDIGTSGPMGDEEARRRANRALVDFGFDISISHIGALSRDARDRAITCVRQAVGCSLRQIQRLTAIAYSAIRRAVASASGTAEDSSLEPATSAIQELTEALKPPLGEGGSSLVGTRKPLPLPALHPI